MNTFLLSLQLASMSLKHKEKESGKASFAAEKKSKPTTNGFLKKSVLVVIKHVYNRQLILSTGEILFIRLQHKITRKIMLVINPHVLNGAGGFWVCHVYLLSYHCNPSPPTSSPDTLPATLCPVWCTYQHISPLIFFTWMQTMLWCLTDSAWALSPVFWEGIIFLFRITYPWASVLPWKEVFQCWEDQLCLYGICLYKRVVPTCRDDQMLCGHFHLAQSPNKYIVPLLRVYLLRHDAMLYKHIVVGLFGVLAESTVNFIDTVLPTVCFTDTFMAMFTLY